MNQKIIESLEIALALSDAVKSIHERGKLHLNIKPSKFTVYHGDRITVELIGSNDLSASEILNGARFGYTPDYAPLEVISNEYMKRINEQSDIFSIGACLFEMLMDRRVTCLDCGIFASWNNDDAFLSAFADCSDNQRDCISNLFKKSIAVTQKRRFKNADELKSAISDAIVVFSV